MKDCVTLICAATQAEARAVLDGITEANAGSRFEVLRTGMGAKRASEALRERLSASTRTGIARVISSGFAGIECTGIPSGSWALGTEVHGRENQPALAVECDEIARLCAPAGLLFHRARFRLADEVIQVRKSSRQTGEAVDMESYALARICQERGIPLSILRLVSDTPEAPLPRAVGAFARVVTGSSALDKASGALQGLGQTLAHPVELGRFLARGTRLQAELREGWRKLASAKLAE